MLHRVSFFRFAANIVTHQRIKALLMGYRKSIVQEYQSFFHLKLPFQYSISFKNFESSFLYWSRRNAIGTPNWSSFQLCPHYLWLSHVHQFDQLEVNWFDPGCYVFFFHEASTDRSSFSSFHYVTVLVSFIFERSFERNYFGACGYYWYLPWWKQMDFSSLIHFIHVPI